MKLKAVSLVCTLSPSPTESSSALLASEVEKELEALGVDTTQVRVVDHSVKFGIKKDMGAGDGCAADERRSWLVRQKCTCRRRCVFGAA